MWPQKLYTDKSHFVQHIQHVCWWSKNTKVSQNIVLGWILHAYTNNKQRRLAFCNFSRSFHVITLFAERTRASFTKSNLRFWRNFRYLAMSIIEIFAFQLQEIIDFSTWCTYVWYFEFIHVHIFVTISNWGSFSPLLINCWSTSWSD